MHLAANPSPQAEWGVLIPANVDMVLNVYEACTATGVSRLIFASSNHVMSGYRDTEIPVLRSDTQPNPGNPYGASKRIGERIGKSFSDCLEKSYLESVYRSGLTYMLAVPCSERPDSLLGR